MNQGQKQPLAGSPLTRFGLPISIVTLIAIPAFLSRIIFLRTLPVEAAAQLVLLFAAIPLCSFIGSMGQSGVVARYYSRMNLGEADWLADLLIGGLIVLLPTLFCVAAVILYNRLDVLLGFALAVSALCFSTTQQIAMMLVATERFTLGSILDRLSGTFLIFPAVIIWLVPGLRSFTFVVDGYTLMNLIILVLGVIILIRTLPRGDKRLSLQQRKVGAAFWISSGVSYLREHLLVVVIQPVVSPLSLAAFDAVSILFRGFEIIRQPLSSIMLVDLTRAEKPAYRRRILGVASFAFTASVAAIVVLPRLLTPLYSGRYDQARWMIPWLILYNVIGWLYVIPSGYLFGRSSESVLARFIRYKVATAVLILTLGSLLTLRVGFPGFLATLVTAVAMQTFLGYLFLIISSKRDSISAGWDPARQLLIE